MFLLPNIIKLRLKLILRLRPVCCHLLVIIEGSISWDDLASFNCYLAITANGLFRDHNKASFSWYLATAATVLFRNNIKASFN